MKVVRSDPFAVTIELTRDELGTISNALNEVCHGPEAIEDWESSTRMGVERSEAQRLLAALTVAYETGSVS